MERSVKKIITLGGMSTLLVLPASALAQIQTCGEAGCDKSIRGMLDWFTHILSRGAVPVLFMIAVFLLVYSIFMYANTTENSGKRREAIDNMLKAFAGIILMFLFFGIISLITNTLGITSTL